MNPDPLPPASAAETQLEPDATTPFDPVPELDEESALKHLTENVRDQDDLERDRRVLSHRVRAGFRRR